MKKLLFSTAMVVSMAVSSQTTVFSADFESTTGWTVADNDGDANNWGIFTLSSALNGFSTGKVAGSRSYSTTAGALTPDNLLISPAITLPATGTLTLQFKVGSADTSIYFAEHYAVYVLPSTATFASTATPVIEETLTTATATLKTINISSMAGQSVKIYFRHYNCTDENILLLDDVAVKQNTTLGTTEVSAADKDFAIYPNPTTDILNIKTDKKVKNATVTDMSGRIVPAKLTDKSMDVSTLETGNYIISVETESGKENRKFIKK